MYIKKNPIKVMIIPTGKIGK